MKAGLFVLLVGVALAAPGAATYGWELLHPESCLEDPQPTPDLPFVLPGCDATDFPVTATFPGRHPVQTAGGALGVCAIVAGAVLVARRRRATGGPGL